MAKLQVQIDGNASGLTGAMAKGQSAVKAFSDAQEQARKQVEAFDAAARRNTMETYNAELRKTSVSVDGISKAFRGMNKEFSLIKNPSFSFGAGGSTSMLPKLNKDLKETTKSFGSASGVAMEFNRIIQDAPFGIMGMGNNITQLTDNFGRLKAQTGSTKEALKQVFSSVMTSGNLLSLGISAAVTGFTLWQMHAQKTRKATKDLEDGTKTYVETLQGVQRASADGQVNAQKDLTNLNLLYGATQNVTMSLDTRRKAAQKLIDQYPSEFKGLTTTEVLAGKAANSYETLSNRIIQSAKAAAYASKIAENSIKSFNNALQANDLGSQLAKAREEVQKAQRISSASIGSAYGPTNVVTDVALISAKSKEKDLTDQIISLNKANADIAKENENLQKSINVSLENGGQLLDNIGGKTKKVKDDSKEIANTIQSLTGDVMSDFDRRVFEVNNRFDEVFKTINKIGNATKKADAFGLATQAKQLELLRIETEKFLYVTSKDYVKPSKNVTVSGSISNTTDLPGLQYAMWLDEARRKNNKPVFKDLEKEAKDLSKLVRRQITVFGRDFIDTISSINQHADVTFSSVFSSLVGSMTKGITGVLQTSLLKSLESFANTRIKDMGPTGSKIAGGVGILGSLISGATKKTSVGGQVAGGALSGAAAGTAILPGWGTAIGAVVGALAGLFSAKSSKNSEKIQEQILEEQRKQNALIERQNALAFTSGIIGQMTNNGLVTGVDRNAQGELVAKVSGQDLLFVMNRAQGKR